VNLERFVGAVALVFTACVHRAPPTLVASAARPAERDPAAPPSTRDDEDALELRLSAAGQSLREQGYAPGPFHERGFLPPNGRVTRAITIAPRTCARFVAVATPSMIDLDASLYRADGAALLEDDSSDARPSLTLCAGAERLDAYYSLHAYQGVGAFASREFVRPATAQDDLITVQEAPSDAGLNDLAKTLHKRGFDDLGPRVELELSAGHPLRVALSAKAGECYTLAAESAGALSGVALRLIDGSEELGHGLAGAAGLASLQYCSDRTRELELELDAAAGAGPVRIARFKAPQSNLGGAHAMWLGEPSPSAKAWGPIDDVRAAVAREIEQTKGGIFESHPLAQGDVVERESRRPLGACERWQALLEPGLVSATLRVEDANGVLLGEAESRAMLAELELCRRPGPVRVSVVGRVGFGAVTLVARPLPAREKNPGAREQSERAR
jgi:hypothetical protein